VGRGEEVGGGSNEPWEVLRVEGWRGEGGEEDGGEGECGDAHGCRGGLEECSSEGVSEMRRRRVLIVGWLEGMMGRKAHELRLCINQSF